VSITPKAEGLSKVYYNKGQCDTGKKKQVCGTERPIDDS
jgi:hypothetical protein